MILAGFAGQADHAVCAAAVGLRVCGWLAGVGELVYLPERRLGTSLMAGRPVARVEESGVVEWIEGEVIWLR